MDSRCFISDKEKQRSIERNGEIKEERGKEGEREKRIITSNGYGSSDNLRSTIRPYIIAEIRFPHVMHGALLANAPFSMVNTFYSSLTLFSARRPAR